MSVRGPAFLLALTLLVPSYIWGQPTEAPRPAQRAAASSIGFKAEPSLTEQLLRTGATFGLLALGLVGAAYAYRYLQGQRLARPGRRLKVVETLALAPKTRLFLVELDDHTILLGQHGVTLSVLSDHARLQEEARDPPAASERR